MYANKQASFKRRQYGDRNFISYKSDYANFKAVDLAFGESAEGKVETPKGPISYKYFYIKYRYPGGIEDFLYVTEHSHKLSRGIVTDIDNKRLNEGLTPDQVICQAEQDRQVALSNHADPHETEYVYFTLDPNDPLDSKLIDLYDKIDMETHKHAIFLYKNSRGTYKSRQDVPEDKVFEVRAEDGWRTTLWRGEDGTSNPSVRRELKYVKGNGTYQSYGCKVFVPSSGRPGDRSLIEDHSVFKFKSFEFENVTQFYRLFKGGEVSVRSSVVTLTVTSEIKDYEPFVAMSQAAKAMVAENPEKVNAIQDSFNSLLARKELSVDLTSPDQSPDVSVPTVDVANSNNAGIAGDDGFDDLDTSFPVSNNAGNNAMI
ncbi:MAG: hypothetical protein GY751_11115 [Bacteroidetes bacterium]|nr:hypothetical protein [Bacteroidota bacterium]